jgi:hypothetical protein
MDIAFTRSHDRRDETAVTRQDGVRLSVPVYGPLEPSPHDLAHYVVELELGLQDGFWASVAAGAIFDYAFWAGCEIQSACVKGGSPWPS